MGVATLPSCQTCQVPCENVTNTSGSFDTGTSYNAYVGLGGADGTNEPIEEDEESGMEGSGIKEVDGVLLGGEN
jgi:hypothetical protein